MNRIHLKAGDVLESYIGNGIKAIGKVLYVGETSLINVNLEGCKIKSYRESILSTDIQCIDIYLEPKMGWTKIDSIVLGSKFGKPTKQKTGVSLSRISFDCMVQCNVFPKEKHSFFENLKLNFWPLKGSVFCDILDNESCLLINKKKIKYDSPEWKEMLSMGKTIHFEDPDYNKYLGSIRKVWKGFIYEFRQGAIQKSVYINKDYVTWPMVDHYWNYYGEIVRPKMFHKSIPPW